MSHEQVDYLIPLLLRRRKLGRLNDGGRIRNESRVEWKLDQWKSRNTDNNNIHPRHHSHPPPPRPPTAPLYRVAASGTHMTPTGNVHHASTRCIHSASGTAGGQGGGEAVMAGIQNIKLFTVRLNQC